MSDVQRAVDLAAWLIATHKQPPGDAIRLAARKYDVDRHEVAQLVGRRGGRVAARRRPRGTATARSAAVTPARAHSPAAPPGMLPGDQVLTLLTISVEPSGSNTQLKGRLLDGPRAGDELIFGFPAGTLPALQLGDRVRFVASFPLGTDGKPRVVLHTFIDVATPADGGLG